jgi:integrase
MDYETSFKNQLAEGFAEKKLATTSIKMYLRNLEKLNDDMPLKNLNFLKDVSAIEQRLAKYKENTKRGYLISIVSALSLDKSNKQKQKLYDDYYKLMMDKNKELKKVEASGEKTETQEKNWITWDEVSSHMNQLEDKIKSFAGNKEINEHQYNVLLQGMILALYVYKAPRRNEYQKMNIVKSDTGLPIDTNYLDMDKKTFTFNTYKTARKEGQIREEIPPELQRVIQTYLKFHPLLKGKKVIKGTNVPFLVYYDGKPLSQVNAITRILNKIFGKKVGSSMLRHIYLSSKYGNVLQEMKEDATAMSHSVDTQKDYIKK